VRIRYSADASPGGLLLNLAEVALFDTSNQQIPRGSLTLTMSTTWGWGNPQQSQTIHVAANCNDGDINTVCATKDKSEDPAGPWLNIQYLCT
jgi:hypothetical protein